MNLFSNNLQNTNFVVKNNTINQQNDYNFYFTIKITLGACELFMKTIQIRSMRSKFLIEIPKPLKLYPNIRKCIFKQKLPNNKPIKIEN